MMMDNEYKSAVSTSTVKHLPNFLRCRYFAGDKIDNAMALARVYKLILKLYIEVPTSPIGKSHRI